MYENINSIINKSLLEKSNFTITPINHNLYESYITENKFRSDKFPYSSLKKANNKPCYVNNIVETPENTQIHLKKPICIDSINSNLDVLDLQLNYSILKHKIGRINQIASNIISQQPNNIKKSIQFDPSEITGKELIKYNKKIFQFKETPDRIKYYHPDELRVTNHSFFIQSSEVKQKKLISNCSFVSEEEYIYLI